MPKNAASQKLKALLESEALFRTLVQRSSDSIHLLDESGRVVYSSDSVQNILGYTPEEAAGGGIISTDKVHPDDVAKFVKTFAKLLATPGGRVTLEHRIQHKDGRWVWVESVGVNHLQTPTIRAVVGVMRDITRRKEIERALAESEARFRFMAESLPQIIFTVDQSGTIDYLNRQWNEYTGMSATRVSSKSSANYIHLDDVERTRQVWRESATDGRPFTVELRLRRADGSYRWHLMKVAPMLDSKGAVVSWIGSSTDIHDVKESERRQQRLEQRAAMLAEQRRHLLELNHAKDEFISLASHQLRTPATGVKQYLGMILEGFVDEEVPSMTLKMIKTAYESNERQLKIVNELLKVAYVDAGRLKPEKTEINLDKLIREVLSELKDQFNQRCQKTAYQNQAKGIKLHADSRLLRMVLENLIDNASKYSPDDTTITVTLQRAAGFLCINITDQGVGIAPKDQARLFKKFSRIENPRSGEVEGTGLGLYWAQQVVALHRGTVMVRSTPGKGSTFSIQLPIPKN